MLFSVFNAEFADIPVEDRPIVMICVLTDGEAADIAAFAQALVGMSAGIYVAIGIVGFGQEHDSALRSFQAVVQAQPRCKLVPLAQGSSAAELASALESMFAEPLSAYGWMQN